MKKEQIIVIGFVVLFIAAVIGGYQFYLQPQLKKFQESREQLQRLDRRLADLQTQYSGYLPEDVVSAWRSRIVPWVEGLEQRGLLFGHGRSADFEPVPEGRIAKFHYAEQYQAMFRALYEEAYEKRIDLPMVNFDVPTDDIANRDMSKADVERWLRRISLGCSLTRFLMEAEPAGIFRVELWPEESIGNLRILRVGYSFAMSPRRLMAFLDRITTQDRFARVDHLLVYNQNLMAGVDAPLVVEMVLTQGEYIATVELDPEAVMARAMTQQSDNTALMAALEARRREMELNPDAYEDRPGARRKLTWWQNFRRKYLPF